MRPTSYFLEHQRQLLEWCLAHPDECKAERDRQAAKASEAEKAEK